tara:strand:+ start:153 stop:464 length:312 start_codon:yes stop_codon:yes gene_type:complete
MIDTSKYEGRTPERWTVDEDDPFRVVDVQDCTIARTDFMDIDEEREWQLANAQLIADAPLLLAEVKWLSALADDLFDLIPSHLSTEATDIWNEYTFGEMRKNE